VSRWLSAEEFPRTSAYLDALGDDLDAHPRCEARTDIYEDLRTEFPAVFTGRGIQPGFVDRIAPPPATWMREVHGVVALTMVRDAAFDSDDAFDQWNYDRMWRLFQKPWIRSMLFVLSPTLVFMNSASRWERAHRGSTLAIRGNAKNAEAVLEFPDGLFSDVFCRGFVQLVIAALKAANADEVSLEIVERTPTLARYRGSWR
jgi:hypothetical protein